MGNFNFGDNLRAIRTRKGYNQEGLGTIMGISQTIYSKVERGKRLPDDKFIAKAAECLKVSVEELTPAGWDQRKQPKIAAQLTTIGKFAYRILLAAATLDLALGFCDAAEIPRPFKFGVLILFGYGAFRFWRYTEKPAEKKGVVATGM